MFNLELLARNLYLNNLNDQVKIAPFALSDRLATSILRMTTTEWGGALSSFIKILDGVVDKLRNFFSFNTLGLSMDQAVSILQFRLPDYINMDVDGIEHFILQSSPLVLSQIKGIHVEINDDFFPEQAEKSKKSLECAGLRLIEKFHSEIFEDSKFLNIYNQIWIRK